MFYSKKYKLLFIACPKTGSRSVEKFLMELDPNGERFSITLRNRRLTSQDMHDGIIGHARARELRKALGPQEFDELHTFGFVRHPLEKFVSGYFFYKSESLKDALFSNGYTTKYIIIKLRKILSILAVKILPFKIWVLIFPHKTNSEYFTGPDGQLIVDYLGRTESLGKDLKTILNHFGLDTNNLNVPHTNKSSHRNYNDYFNNNLIRNWLKKKYRSDLEFYNKASSEMDKLSKNN